MPFELTEDFLKIIQIVIAIIGVLAIFLIFIQYEITVSYSEAERQSTLFGDALMGSKCLADEDLNENIIKGLFLEDKLNSLSSDPACLKNIYNNGKIEISSTKSWTIELGSTPNNVKSEFSIAIKLSNGEVVPGRMVVTV